MALVLGFNAKTYYATDGVQGGTFVELDNIKDLTLGVTADEADVSRRSSGGWKASLATLKEGNIQFDMVYDTTDAGFTAIKNAFFDNTTLGMRFWDSAVGGGLEADCTVTGFDRNEQLAEALTVSITLRPTQVSGGPAPAWVD